MIYYEVVQDIGDGYAVARKFRYLNEAEKFMNNSEGCLNGVGKIDTDAPDFFDTLEEDEPYDDEDDDYW